MAQLVVRNLEDAVKTRLRERAALHGRSMEEEVREILRDAVNGGDDDSGGLGSEIVAMFSGQGLGFQLPPRPEWKMRPSPFVDEVDQDDDPA